MLGNAFVTDQCTEFFFFSFRSFFVFGSIRTQAFSVFSEVSGGGTAATQNKTQMSESERDGMWTTSCLFFFTVSFLFFFFLSPVLFITSSLWGGFGLKHRCVREQLPFVIIFKTHSFHGSTLSLRLYSLVSFGCYSINMMRLFFSDSSVTERNYLPCLKLESCLRVVRSLTAL